VSKTNSQVDFEFSVKLDTYILGLIISMCEFEVCTTMKHHYETSAFSALTLLVGRQEGHPACKKLSGGVLAWLSVWSEVQTYIWSS